VFDVFARHQVSVDVVATSEVSVSLTLDPKRIWAEGEVDEEIDRLVYDLEKIANAHVTKDTAIVSLICNVQRTSEILQRVRLGARGGG
jgi:aspartate kinase